MWAERVYSHASAGPLSGPVRVQCTCSRRAPCVHIRPTHRHAVQPHATTTPDLQLAPVEPTNMDGTVGSSSSTPVSPSVAVEQHVAKNSSNSNDVKGDSVVNNGMHVINRQHRRRLWQQHQGQNQGTSSHRSQADEAPANDGRRLNKHGDRARHSKGRRVEEQAQESAPSVPVATGTQQQGELQVSSRGRGRGRSEEKGRGSGAQRAGTDSGSTKPWDAGGPVCCSLDFAQIAAVKPAGPEVVQHVVLAQSLLDTWAARSAAAAAPTDSIPVAPQQTADSTPVAAKQTADSTPAATKQLAGASSTEGAAAGIGAQTRLQVLKLHTSSIEEVYEALCVVSVLQLLLRHRYPGHTLLCTLQAHSGVQWTTDGVREAANPPSLQQQQQQWQQRQQQQHQQPQPNQNPYNGSGPGFYTATVSDDQAQRVTWSLYCVTSLPDGALYEPPAVRLRVGPKDDANSLAMWMESAVVRHAHMRMTVSNKHAAHSAINAFLHVAHKLQAVRYYMGFVPQQWATHSSAHRQQAGADRPPAVYQMDVLLCKATPRDMWLVKPKRLKLPLHIAPAPSSAHAEQIAEGPLSMNAASMRRTAQSSRTDGTRTSPVDSSAKATSGSPRPDLARGSSRVVSKRERRSPSRPAPAPGSLRDLVSDVFEEHYPTPFTTPATAPTAAAVQAEHAAASEEQAGSDQQVHADEAGHGQMKARQRGVHAEIQIQRPSHASKSAKHATRDQSQAKQVQAQASTASIGRMSADTGVQETGIAAVPQDHDLELQQLQPPVRLVVNTFDNSPQALARQVRKATMYNASCLLLARGSRQLALVNKTLLSVSLELFHGRFAMEQQRRDRAKRQRQEKALQARIQQQLRLQQAQVAESLAIPPPELLQHGNNGVADDQQLTDINNQKTMLTPVSGQNAAAPQPSTTAASQPDATIGQAVSVAVGGVDISTSSTSNSVSVSTHPSAGTMQSSSDNKHVTPPASSTTATSSTAPPGSVPPGSAVPASLSSRSAQRPALPADVLQVPPLPQLDTSVRPALAAPPVRPIRRPTAPTPPPLAAQSSTATSDEAAVPATAAAATLNTEVAAAEQVGVQQQAVVLPQLAEQQAASAVPPANMPGEAVENATESEQELPPLGHALLFKVRHYPDEEDSEHFDEFPSYQGLAAHCVQVPSATIHQYLQHTPTPYPVRSCSNYFKIPEPQVAQKEPRQPPDTQLQEIRQEQASADSPACRFETARRRSHRNGTGADAAAVQPAWDTDAQRGSTAVHLPELEGLESLGGVEIIGADSDMAQVSWDEDDDDGLWDPTSEHDDESDPELSLQVQGALWHLARFGVVYLVAAGRGARLRVLKMLAVMNDVLGLRGGLEAVAMVVDNSDDKINTLANLRLKKPGGTLSMALYTVILAADISKQQLIDPQHIPVPHQPILKWNDNDSKE